MRAAGVRGGASGRPCLHRQKTDLGNRAGEHSSKVTNSHRQLARRVDVRKVRGRGQRSGAVSTQARPGSATPAEETSPELTVLADAKQVSNAAAEEFVCLARRSIESKGEFDVALAGGSTPRAAYEILAK